MGIFNRISRFLYLIPMLLLGLRIAPAVHAQDTSNQILYAVSDENGDHTIYTVNIDDGLKTQIGIVRNNDSDTGWSPDGKFIYLLDNTKPDYATLTLINADTNQRQTIADPLIARSCLIPVEWSPSGAWIAYSTHSDSGQRRKIFNPTTGDTQVLPDANIDFPATFWSYDEHYLAYLTGSQSDNRLWTIWDVQNKQTIIQFTPDTWEYPQWSPSENNIAYSSDPDHITIYNAVDSTKQEYESSSIGNWSPNWRYLILHTRDKDQHTLLSILDVLTREALSLDSGVIFMSNAETLSAWSSNSRYLAIARQIEGNDDQKTLYFLDVLKKSIKSTKFNFSYIAPFAWSPQGNRLGIITDVENFDGMEFFTSLWLIDADKGESQRYNIKMSIMSYQRPNWSPNGRYLLVWNDDGIQFLNLASGKLGPIDNGIHYFLSPRWSPDGSSLAVTTDNDIYIFAPDENKLTNITQTPDEEETILGWRGAGSSISLRLFCGGET